MGLLPHIWLETSVPGVKFTSGRFSITFNDLTFRTRNRLASIHYMILLTIFQFLSHFYKSLGHSQASIRSDRKDYSHFHVQVCAEDNLVKKELWWNTDKHFHSELSSCCLYPRQWAQPITSVGQVSHTAFSQKPVLVGWYISQTENSSCCRRDNTGETTGGKNPCWTWKHKADTIS